MLSVTWRQYLPLCLPLALMACGNTDRQAQLGSQVAAADQEPDQALSVAQQAQDANARANQQFQRGLQK
jgi:hypothetical protein